MKRWILALAPWMVVASVMAQSEGAWPAEVAFTHYGKISTPAWQIGQDCYVPIEAARKWGWGVKLNRFDVSLTADGRTATLPFRLQAGHQVFSLGLAARKFGGNGEWISGTRTYQVFGIVRGVAVQDGVISIEATLAAKPRISYLANPARLVLDFDGMKLDSRAQPNLGIGSRVAQFEPTVVRIVLETDLRPTTPAHQIRPSRTFSLNIAASANPPDGEEIAVPIHTSPPVQPPTNNQDLGSFGGALRPPVEQEPIEPVLVVGPPTLEGLSERKSVLTVRADRELMSSVQLRRLSANVLELVLPGAQYVGDLESRFESAFVESVQAAQGPASVTYTILLARPVGVELSREKYDVKLVLHMPKVGDGKLSSKTVVVDAGHGGHDSGAKAPDGSAREKNLNLAIATLLSQALIEEGATVIMTRKTDVFIPLKERPAIANRTAADFFVSIHINSNAARPSTGGMTFYHARDPIGQLLAECIQGEIAKVSKLKSLGAWSDYRLYDTGLAVLRYSTMPAVLIEMGFINNPADRARMLQKDFQRDVASAIVQGLKVFLGDEND